MNRPRNNTATKADQCTPIRCETCGHRKDNPVCGHEFTLPEIAKIRRDISLEEGQVLFRSGESIEALYSVRSGLIKLEVNAKSGASHTLQFLGPGTAFGYRELFNGAPSLATAIAIEASEICLLPKADVMPILNSNREILVNLLSSMADGAAEAEKKWLDQIEKGAVERVAEALIFLDEQFPTVQWTRRDIAQWAGTTPETVIRALSQFEKEGLIDQSAGRSIRLLNKSGLLIKFNSQI